MRSARADEHRAVGAQQPVGDDAPQHREEASLVYQPYSVLASASASPGPLKLAAPRAVCACRSDTGPANARIP